MQLLVLLPQHIRLEGSSPYSRTQFTADPSWGRKYELRRGRIDCSYEWPDLPSSQILGTRFKSSTRIVFVRRRGMQHSFKPT